MAAILIIAAYIFLAIGGIMVLIEAFRESVLWGVACLFLPIVSLFFIIVHWDAAKRGVLFQLFGFALLMIGFIAAPTSGHRFH